jgi:hypothetical protein
LKLSEIRARQPQAARGCEQIRILT